MNWTYKEKEIKEIEDLPENTFGFIYEITHLPTGKKYIGKKQLLSERNVKLGKKETEILKEERKLEKKKGKTPSKKKVIKESDWKTYYGSHQEIKEMVKNGKKEDFKREILLPVFSKKLLTYFEMKYLLLREVIEPGSLYINDNISGHFFRKDFLSGEDIGEDLEKPVLSHLQGRVKQPYRRSKKKGGEG
mgnify:CR=1 FL=1